jgi:hypothetical protein
MTGREKGWTRTESTVTWDIGRGTGRKAAMKGFETRKVSAIVLPRNDANVSRRLEVSWGGTLEPKTGGPRYAATQSSGTRAPCLRGGSLAGM